MDQHIKKVIRKISLQASIFPKEQKDLERELTSHFYEKERDLHLETKDSLCGQLAVSDFGDVDQISKEFFYTRYPYLKIPLIGPLFFFPALRRAAFFFAIFLISLLIINPLLLWILPFVVTSNNQYPSYAVICYILIPLGLPLLLGFFLLKKFVRIAEILPGLLISLAPFICVQLILILTRILFYPKTIDTYLTYESFTLDVITLYPVILAQVLWSLFLLAGWLIRQLIFAISKRLHTHNFSPHTS